MTLFVNAENDVWMDGVTVNGQQLRLQQAGQFLTSAAASGSTGIAGRPGVRDAPGSPLLVSASSGMNLTLNAGTCWVQGTTAATSGMYTACLDTTATGAITVAASDPTNPRIDNVIAQITDVGSSSSTTVITLQTGTPAPSPVAPTLPANSLLLATVAVAALATSITAGNITDKRVFTTGLGGVVKMDTSGGIVGPAGQFAYDSITGRLKVSDGSGNARQPKAAAFAPAVSRVASGVSVASSGNTSLTSVVVTTDGFTEIQVVLRWDEISCASPALGTSLNFFWTVDGSVPTGAGSIQWVLESTTANQGGGACFVDFTVPTAGTHTVALFVGNSSSTSGISVFGSYVRVAASLQA